MIFQINIIGHKWRGATVVGTLKLVFIRKQTRDDVIKYSVLYPNIKGGTFDHDYYRDVHLPLIKRRMGEYCHSYAIDKMPEGTPAETPFIAACHIYCLSMEDFEKGMKDNAADFVADVANFTNIEPVKMIFDVVV